MLQYLKRIYTKFFGKQCVDTNGGTWTVSVPYEDNGREYSIQFLGAGDGGGGSDLNELSAGSGGQPDYHSPGGVGTITINRFLSKNGQNQDVPNNNRMYDAYPDPIVNKKSKKKNKKKSKRKSKK